MTWQEHVLSASTTHSWTSDLAWLLCDTERYRNSPVERSWNISTNNLLDLLNWLDYNSTLQNKLLYIHYALPVHERQVSVDEILLGILNSLLFANVWNKFSCLKTRSFGISILPYNTLSKLHDAINACVTYKPVFLVI